jgi:hypothetical protein
MHNRMRKGLTPRMRNALILIFAGALLLAQSPGWAQPVQNGGIMLATVQCEEGEKLDQVTLRMASRKKQIMRAHAETR